MSTHCLPVRGREHLSTILCFPFLATCSMVTTTFVPLDPTRSIAPPIPFTTLPCFVVKKLQYKNIKKLFKSNMYLFFKCVPYTLKKFIYIFNLSYLLQSIFFKFLSYSTEKKLKEKNVFFVKKK